MGVHRTRRRTKKRISGVSSNLLIGAGSVLAARLQAGALHLRRSKATVGLGGQREDARKQEV